jgi:RNase P/RNase MRP subunit p29
MSSGLDLGDRVRVVDSHETRAGVTGTVVGWSDAFVLVEPDRAKLGLPATIFVEWWLLEVIR